MDAPTQLLFDRYAHNRDDYAVQTEIGAYIRTGRPLTPDVLAQHLAGRLSIATYLLAADDSCRLGVLDHDDRRLLLDLDPHTHRRRSVAEDGLLLLRAAAMRLAEVGVESALFASGRGGQLHVYAREPVHAVTMRALLGLAIGETETQALERGERALELFPARVTRGQGIGPAMRVPFGVHRKYGPASRFPLLLPRPNSPVFELADQLTTLATVQPADVAAVVAAQPDLLQRMAALDRRYWQNRGETPPDQSTERAGPAPSAATAARFRLGAHSPIGRWLAAVSTRQVALLLGAELDKRGYGRCPLPAHHAHGDRTPSFEIRNDQSWSCYRAQESGQNAFDLVAWVNGYDHHNLRGGDARAVLSLCQQLVPAGDHPSVATPRHGPS